MMPLIEQLIGRANQNENEDKKWDILGKLMTARAVHGDKSTARKMTASMPSTTYSQDAFKGRTQREIAKKYAEAGDFKTAIVVINEIDVDFTYYSAVARTDITALAIEAGQLTLVYPLFKEALAIAELQDNGYFSGAILRDIGYSQVKMGETKKAQNMFTEALDLARNAKSDQEKARAMSRIATRMADCGLTDQSAAILTEALSITRRIDSDMFTNYALYEIAGSAAFSGEFDMAKSLLTEIPEAPFGSAVSLRAASERDLAWGLARHENINEALSVANSITSQREKVHTLSRLVRLLKTPEMNALPRYLYMSIKIIKAYKLALLSASVVIMASCGQGTPKGGAQPVKDDDTRVKAVIVQNPAQEKPEPETVLDPVLKRGKRMFLRCKSCHTLEAGGSNGTGPNLHGVFGAQAAQKEGFSYSKAMVASELVWDDATMDAWIEKPNTLVPKTSMAFIGIDDAEDRAALIKYLKMGTE